MLPVPFVSVIIIFIVRIIFRIGFHYFVCCCWWGGAFLLPSFNLMWHFCDPFSDLMKPNVWETNPFIPCKLVSYTVRERIKKIVIFRNCEVSSKCCQCGYVKTMEGNDRVFCEWVGEEWFSLFLISLRSWPVFWFYPTHSYDWLSFPSEMLMMFGHWKLSGYEFLFLSVMCEIAENIFKDLALFDL